MASTGQAARIGGARCKPVGEEHLPPVSGNVRGISPLSGWLQDILKAFSFQALL